MDITQRMLRERAKDRTKTEAEELAELAALGINHPARRRHRERERIKKEQRLERGWNGSISRSRPPNLYGLKCATKEPWAIDEMYYQKKTGNMEEEFNELEKYDDRSVLAASKGYTAQVASTGSKGVSQPAWDSSPLRPVPHALKGIKPVTREPWYHDQMINRDMDVEGFDTFSAKVENDSVAGNMAFWKGGRARQEGNWGPE